MLILTFLISSALAQAPDLITLRFNVAGTEQVFLRDEANHLTLSEACARKPKTCLAMKAAKSATTYGLSASLRGGANPGSVICTAQGGNVIWVVDTEGNETTLCEFPDHSMITNGSLRHYASLNDSAKK